MLRRLKGLWVHGLGVWGLGAIGFRVYGFRVCGFTGSDRIGLRSGLATSDCHVGRLVN